MKKTFHYLMILTVVSLSGSSGGQRAWAQEEPPGIPGPIPIPDPTPIPDPFPIPVLNLCLINAADAAMMYTQKNASGYLFDSRESNGTAYNASGCTSYIAELTALSSYEGPFESPRFTISAGFQYALSQAACSYGNVRYAVYRKTYNLLTGTYSDWALQDSGNFDTYWFTDPDVTPHCVTSFSKTYTKPATLFVRHIYRVLVLPRYFGNAASARVSWQWSY